MYMEEVTADDIRLALIPLSNKSESLHNTVNMLLKCIFYSAERSQLLEYNPCEGFRQRRETDPKERFADRPAGGSAAGNRQRTSAVSVYHDRLICRSAPRRSSRLAIGIVCSSMHPLHISLCGAQWRSEHNRPVISTTLKTKAARRDIPIPKCLVNCLREAKAASKSEYVIADSGGTALVIFAVSKRVWQYIVVRSTKERTYYKYVNGQSIKYTVQPSLGGHQKKQSQHCV